MYLYFTNDLRFENYAEIGIVPLDLERRIMNIESYIGVPFEEIISLC